MADGLREERRPPAQAYARYINSHAWRLRRAAAIVAADSRCQVCNCPDALVVHHRTYARFREELPGDLTVLCATCHAMYHRSPESRKPGPELIGPWEALTTWAAAELHSQLQSIAYSLGSVHNHALRREAEATLRQVDRQYAKYYAEQATKRQAS